MSAFKMCACVCVYIPYKHVVFIPHSQQTISVLKPSSMCLPEASVMFFQTSGSQQGVFFTCSSLTQEQDCNYNDVKLNNHLFCSLSSVNSTNLHSSYPPLTFTLFNSTCGGKYNLKYFSAGSELPRTVNTQIVTFQPQFSGT